MGFCSGGRLSDARAEASIRQALSDGGPTAAARFVRDGWVDAFVICGTVSECRSELAALVADNGIDEFQVSVNDLNTAAEDLAVAAEIARSPN